MKPASFLLLIMLSCIVNVFGQKLPVDLTFTAIDNKAYIRLDSIKVMNLSQGNSVKLYWPDTTLSNEITPGDLLLFIGYAMDYPVGFQSLNKGERKFQIFQNYPNPVRDKSVISLYVPSKGSVNIIVADVRGRIAVNIDQKLDEGTYSFRFLPGDERIYIITARWNGITQSIKILMAEAGGKTCKLEYIGVDHQNQSLKQSQIKEGFVVKESGILDTPYNDTTYTFQFATNIPCPGTPTVNYEGQVYNTIQIFSQCWFKENLNVGTMIYGGQEQTNNSIIEKYCNNNKTDSCTKYGGLYQWDEMMQYTNQQGAQGICPHGWHIPDDQEWNVLEGAVDSQYGIGDPVWDLPVEYRGYDAGKNLKTTSGWNANGNGTDLFGFSGLPGGDRVNYLTYFYSIGFNGFWWASTEQAYYIAWGRYLEYDNPGVFRFYNYHLCGFSVRCLRDY